MDKRREEYQDFKSKIFRLTVPEIFVCEPSCAVLQEFLVAKKFMDKREAEEYQDFPSKTFCLTVPKNFVVQPFCAVLQELPVAKLFLDKRRGGVSIFSVEKIFSQYRKISSLNPSVLCFSSFPVMKKFLDKGAGGKSRLSVERFIISQCRKIP